MDAIYEIIDELKKSLPERLELNKIKARVARKYRLKKMPKNSDILALVKEEDRSTLGPILQRKPVRTISGIAIVAVMTRPHPCPGECIYCPVGENSPQSYTGEEPAALRAKRVSYDPYLQVADRLLQLQKIGHPVDKVELIVMGGTFNAHPEDYQKWFIKRCFDALNNSGVKSPQIKSLEEVQILNESARVRNVGLTLETRPDFIDPSVVNDMLEFGVTRVELGVQTLKDSVYKKVKRGHSVKDVAIATKILRDSGIKVGYHMMPGLFSDFDEDIEMIQTLFSDERFKPDFLKIYPTLVIPGTGLYKLWKKGEFVPYTDEEAIELLLRMKSLLPKWVRTMRIQRDIPKKLIAAGVKKGDLGAIVHKKLKEKNVRCRCIRCRDIGHLKYRGEIKFEENVEVLSEKYSASGGIEYFISAEDMRNDALIAYLRLRINEKSQSQRAMVRELRVLGPMVPIGARKKGARQHEGWGSMLLQKAEEASIKNGSESILVNSAIGTREYYRKRGYKRHGSYMEKPLKGA